MKTGTAAVVLAVVACAIALAVLGVLFLNRQLGSSPPQPSNPSVPSNPSNPSTPSVDPASGSGVCDPQVVLAKHNEYRRKHGREPLRWDARLAASAQKKADECRFQHDGAMLDGKLLGENLAYGEPRNYTCAQMIQGMYVTEEKPRGSDKNLPDGGINHVTQILWPSATKVGCGLTRCPSLGNNMACHYDVPTSKRR